MVFVGRNSGMPYDLLRRIASGGSAEVMLAGQSDGSLVVVKRLTAQVTDPDVVARFRREAEISASLDHPNLARIHEITTGPTGLALVMEYVSGEDLRFLIRETRTAQRIPLAVACAIVDQIAAGLAHVHGATTPDGRPRGIVHRDISPSNVMVTYDGRVKVVDFGLAKVVSPDRLSEPGKLHGKLSYMAPEHIQGRAVDHRADLFSLGAVFYELLTSRRLFTGANEGAIIRNVLERHVPPPSLYHAGLPQEIDQLVLALLRRDVASRTPSAEALRAQLAAVFPPEGDAIARWMSTQFAPRCADRMQLERIAMDEATRGVVHDPGQLAAAFRESVHSDSTPRTSAEIPRALALELSGAAPLGEPPAAALSDPMIAPALPPAPPRSRRPIIAFAAGGTALMIGIVAWRLSVSGTPAPGAAPTPAVVTQPAPPSRAAGAAAVVVEPAQAARPAALAPLVETPPPSEPTLATVPRTTRPNRADRTPKRSMSSGVKAAPSTQLSVVRPEQASAPKPEARPPSAPAADSEYESNPYIYK
ncbi:MAG: serine/threonine-protein kinase [Kofleriaceae bacterium]